MSAVVDDRRPRGGCREADYESPLRGPVGSTSSSVTTLVNVSKKNTQAPLTPDVPPQRVG